MSPISGRLVITRSLMPVPRSRTYPPPSDDWRISSPQRAGVAWEYETPGSDVEAEPVSHLTDVSEVGASVPVQEPCDILCAARFHCFAGLPSVLSSKYKFGCDNEGSTDMSR
jgi:hypothetical protein